MTRYPNVIPEGQRHGYYHKDRYSSGPVRDGHKILRNECDEDGIEVVHPKGCEIREDWGGGMTYVSYNCPFAGALEGADGVLDLYCDGRQGERLADLDLALPRGVEVEVTWESNAGASWTDCGWEYDGEFSWWFGDEPHLAEAGASSTTQPQEAGR